MDYDPEKLSYSDLLEIFWNGHRHERNNPSRQYINAVFFRNAEQQKLAEQSRDALNGTVATEILPVGQFTYAECYHHKYYLTRYEDVRGFLETIYTDAKSLADSTVAMRLNAYLASGMRRDWSQFLAELPDYGLPEHLESHLRELGEKQTG